MKNSIVALAWLCLVVGPARAESTAPGRDIQTRCGDKSVILRWERSAAEEKAGYSVYRADQPDGPFHRLNEAPIRRSSYVDFDVANRRTYYYQIRTDAANIESAQVIGDVAAMPDALNDSTFLDLLQRTSFDFFWYEANAANGLIRDRDESWAPCSIASVGFGLSAICTGIDHEWITRDAGRQRVLNTLNTFWTKPQGNQATGVIGHKGFFYHFLEMNTGYRTWNCELSSVDTALLLAGILHARMYFSEDQADELMIRQLADSIYYRVDWQWMRNYQPNIMLGWFPDTGFINAWWRGYNEAMIMCILALGSPTHPVPASTWSAWTGGYAWKTHYGQTYIEFPPLFGHHYSHCWIDFRNIQDGYTSAKGITYFENSARATLAQRAYCIDNPGNFVGYGDNVWGLTACDGPNGYQARGAPPAQNDNGTIAPTAAGGSIAFTPEVSIPALKHMYDTYRTSIWKEYGFRDAFNLTQNWWGPDVIGIDEGPIVLMIENHLTGRVWEKFMQNEDIQRGLERAGFSLVDNVEAGEAATPLSYQLQQNAPNPFNPATTIRYSLPKAGFVTLTVFNLMGQEVATLVNGPMPAGNFSVNFDAANLSSGIYFYRLQADDFSAMKKMIVVE